MTMIVASACFDPILVEKEGYICSLRCRGGAMVQLMSRHFHVCTLMVESYGVGIVYQLVGTYLETDWAGTKYENCGVIATIALYGFVYL